jgi:hypothetical protein
MLTDGVTSTHVPRETALVRERVRDVVDPKWATIGDSGRKRTPEYVSMNGSGDTAARRTSER